MVSFLLENGADPNQPLSALKILPLHIAIQTGNRDIIEKLLNTPGIDINLTNLDGNTPLHAAVLTGNKAIITLLLQHGADPNKKNDNNETPKQLAGSNNEILALLGANWEARKIAQKTEEDEMTKTHDVSATSNPQRVNSNNSNYPQSQAPSSVLFHKENPTLMLLANQYADQQTNNEQFSIPLTKFLVALERFARANPSVKNVDLFLKIKDVKDSSRQKFINLYIQQQGKVSAQDAIEVKSNILNIISKMITKSDSKDVQKLYSNFLLEIKQRTSHQHPR